MQVHTIQADELAQLLALYAQLNEQDDAPDPQAAELAWIEAMGNPRCRYYGGYEDDLLVASCTIMVIPNLTRGARPYALIENVITHRAYRNRGWGKAVLTAACKFAWTSGCYKIMLMTGRHDEAVYRFYESAGFARHSKQAFVMRADQ